MKKIALTLTAASMMFVGMAGCGDTNDAGMTGNQNQSGFSTNHGRGLGEPTGFGANRGRENEHTNTGFIQEGRGQQRGFVVKQNRGTGTSGFGAGTGQGIGNNTQTRGAGQDGGFLTRERGFGSGYDYQTGTRNPGTGIHGQNRANRGNVTGFEARENAQHRGFGRGITGDDRPGMVDENGVLNDSYNARGRGLMNRGQNRNVQHGSQFGTDGPRGQNEGKQGKQGGTRGLNQGTQRNRDGTRGLNQGTNQNQRNDAARHLNHGKYGADAFESTDHDWFYIGEENGDIGDNDGRLSRRISERINGMDNVNDPRVIVHGNDVVIGMDTDGDADQLQNNIRNDLRGLTGNRQVHVTTDRNHVGNIRKMDDRLRAGEPFEEIGATFNDMIQDLGNAIQRPFERSR